MRPILLLCAALLVPGSASAQSLADRIPQVEDQCVVLVHGLGRGESSFFVMEKLLSAAGYQVVNVDYPSRSATVEELVTYLDEAVAECGDQKVNFVTHSLGGILIRGWLGLKTPENLGRVVMLAPPNHGSEVVDAIGDLALYQFITGPAGQQLGTDKEKGPARFGPVDFDLGVIAGNMSVNPVFSAMIPGEDDGAVSVESTKIDGMADHIVLPATHTLMMNNPLVIAETMIFLQTGRFDPDLTYGELARRLTEGTSEDAE
ncbi:alpha/beta fold hydrolase [Methyloligella sp. 2.7D]|uniref:alpha/beta fold hydrolase n=1 Tax=unclassified Methyloligella TaxID=2625955 RepID=UPI00157DF528|nr:alpha/beta fold hydrolase [Methyloligella sp. GL2]QKP78440.1 alpha/beta fold hydrolase [Methyloligella sp. GL2]